MESGGGGITSGSGHTQVVTGSRHSDAAMGRGMSQVHHGGSYAGQVVGPGGAGVWAGRTVREGARSAYCHTGGSRDHGGNGASDRGSEASALELTTQASNN